MLSRTHMRIGAATSLAILQPTTLPATVVSVAGGYLGGWTCDVDSHNKEEAGDYTDGWGILIPLGIVMALDYLLGAGICKYIIAHRSYTNLVGIGAFLLLLFVGSRTNHHTFTHSLLAVLLYSVALFFVFPPMVPSFVIGMVLHILVDLLGYQGVRVLYPLSFNPCFKITGKKKEERKKVSDVTGFLALAATLVLAVWFSARSIGESSNIPEVVSEAQSSIAVLGLSSFQLYLVAVNIVSFVVLIVSFNVQRSMTNERVWRVVSATGVAFEYVLALLGGAVGLCLGQIVIALSGKLRDGGKFEVYQDEVYWYVLYLASAVSWALVYLTVAHGGADFARLASFNPLGHLPLLAGFAAINVATYFAFDASGDGRTKEGKSKKNRFLLLMLCAAGGSIGGFLAMAVTGAKRGIEYFKLGVPLLIIPNAVCLVCLVLLGVA